MLVNTFKIDIKCGIDSHSNRRIILPSILDICYGVVPEKWEVYAKSHLILQSEH